MNALVKKEIRLLLPSSLVVLALVILVPWFWKDPETSFAWTPVFIFFGIILLAVDSFGREFSLGTFSSLMAQPMERGQIWRTKITVLFFAAILIYAAYFISSEFLLHRALKIPVWSVNPKIINADFRGAMFGSVAAFLAALVGGLWTTLLFRQIAAAFWITFLTPAAALMLIVFFLPAKLAANDHFLIPLLYSLAGIYCITGFWFAHRLFHRAQDVAWTGGVITFSRWRYFESSSKSFVSTRQRQPVWALLKKELQLQSISFVGAGTLLALHVGIFFMRVFYGNFHKNSLVAEGSDVFWLLWLVMPLVIGCMAVAEERKLGVVDGQFCQPVSRRMQFTIKFLLAMILGVLFGGVMPLLLETTAARFGASSEVFKPQNLDGNVFISGRLFLIVAATLCLVAFFASTLARNFLQALSVAIVGIVACVCSSWFLIRGSPFSLNDAYLSFGVNLWGSVTPILIGIPTMILLILWLSYRNFSHFIESRRLWRRNLLGFVGAMLFVSASGAVIYNRAWEIFEPVEPPHGAAKLSLANPPNLQMLIYENLLVRLPDGRVWYNRLEDSGNRYEPLDWKFWTRALLHPLPTGAGPQKFIAGSNWVAAATGRVYMGAEALASGKWFYSWGNLGTVGIQSDGTLWASGKPNQSKWTPDAVQRFGSESNWQQLVISRSTVVLLKNNGTLWSWGLWGTETNGWGNNEHEWPGLLAFEPQQIGTNSDWQELFSDSFSPLARQANGHAWVLDAKNRNVIQEMKRAKNYDQVASKTTSLEGYQHTAFVRPDGTLWMLNRYWDEQSRRDMDTGILQVGKENDWRAVAVSYQMMVAIKADGSLWQWNYKNESAVGAANTLPSRLGIHHDWVGLTRTWGGAIALAADGSLWFWPDRSYYGDYNGPLIKLPKQPQLLGNIFGKSE